MIKRATIVVIVLAIMAAVVMVDWAKSETPIKKIADQDEYVMMPRVHFDQLIRLIKECQGNRI